MNQSKSVGVACLLRHRISGAELYRGANRLRLQPSTEKLGAMSTVQSLVKKSSLWPMPVFSTPRSAFTSESKSSPTGLGVLVSLSPQRARKPKFPFGRPNRSNWEIWEFPKTLSREFCKFPRTNTQAFAGFLVHGPVNYLFSQGCFGNFRQS